MGKWKKVSKAFQLSARLYRGERDSARLLAKELQLKLDSVKADALNYKQQFYETLKKLEKANERLERASNNSKSDEGGASSGRLGLHSAEPLTPTPKASQGEEDAGTVPAVGGAGATVDSSVPPPLTPSPQDEIGELIECLRYWAKQKVGGCVALAAIAALEALRAENERLKEIVEGCADRPQGNDELVERAKHYVAKAPVSGADTIILELVGALERMNPKYLDYLSRQNGLLTKERDAAQETVAALERRIKDMEFGNDFLRQDRAKVEAALERMEQACHGYLEHAAALRSQLEKLKDAHQLLAATHSTTIEQMHFYQDQSLKLRSALEKIGGETGEHRTQETVRTALGVGEKNAACSYCGSYLNDNGVCPSCG